MDATNQYFDNICRTCMHEMAEASSYADKQWLTIFDIISECDGLSVAELLSSTVPRIKVHQTDQLPKKVCLECLHQLKNSYSFQKMCLHADQQIHEMMMNVDLNGFPQTPQPTSAYLLNAIEKEIDIKNFEIDVHEYVKNEPSIDAQTIQPSILELTEHVLVPETTCMSRYIVADIEYTNNLSEKSQSSATDVQSNDEQIEYSKTAQVVVKNEPCKEEEFIAESSNELMRVIAIPMGLVSLTHNCHLCKKSFTQSSLLKRHLEHHVKGEENNDLLDLDPKEKSPTNRNRLKCTDPELFQVRDCQTGSSPQNAMPPEGYPCDLCQKLYSSQSSLRSHKNHYCAKNSQKTKKKYKCKTCSETFDTRVGIERHKSIHTGEQPYICPECGKPFIDSRTLTHHRLSHTGVKTFECPVCLLKFYDRGNFSQHKEVHAGIKPHVCDVCGKRFDRSYRLAIHKKFHSGEKRFKCDYCDMGFVMKYDQLCHMRNHTGEKPYKCKYCDHGYTQCASLIKHLRIHLGDMIHRCELCPSAFRFASELRTHSSKHKNDDKKTRERNLKALKEAEAKLEIKSLKKINKNKKVK